MLRLLSCCALLMSVSLTSCAPTVEKVEEINAAREMFRTFQTAMREQQGTVGIQHLSDGSIARFEQFRSWAAKDTLEDLPQRTLFEQIEVLRLRHLFSPSELAESSGRAILEQLINRGELPVPFLEDATLADPVYKNDRCYFQIYDGRGAVKEKLTFLKEDGDWVVDLPSLEFITEKVYARLVRVNQLSEEEAIAQVVAGFPEPADGPIAEQ